MNRFAVPAACLVVLFLSDVAYSAKAELTCLTRVTNNDRHNAFTDLIRYEGQYYLCYRDGEDHGSFDGKIVVMRSGNLENWETVKTFDTWGDDRDPHFVAGDGKLHVYFGTWDLRHPANEKTAGRDKIRSYISSTTDTFKWSPLSGMFAPGWWLWRVRYHEGLFYTAAYSAFRPHPLVRETRLLASEDGIDWRFVGMVSNDRGMGEADFGWDENERMWMISRTGDEAGDANWMESDIPYTDWTERPMGVLVHSPVCLEWDGRLFVAGRGRVEGNANTTLWEIRDGKLDELLVLPSGGDTAYPGMIVDEERTTGDSVELILSWYSQHEVGEGRPKEAADVFVGRVRVLQIGGN